MRDDWARRGLPEFHVRMGINTGRVLAGNVGSNSRLKVSKLFKNVLLLTLSRAQYTLIGGT